MALQGLRNALALPFPRIRCNVVVNRHNYKDLPDYAAFLAGLAALRPPRLGLAMFVSVMNDNPAWERLCVSHTEVAPYLARAAARGAAILRLSGDCAMPICVADLWRSAPQLAPELRIVSPTWYAPERAGSLPAMPARFARVKAQACRGCAFDANCAGVSAAYARRFGLQELRPVARPC